MRQIRSFLPLLCLALLYWGCQKADTANHPPALLATKPTTTTINVQETVAVKTIVTDSLITNFKQLAALFSMTGKTETDGLNSPQVAGQLTPTYKGYTK